MVFSNIRRVLKWGMVNFLRNSVVSFSSVLVMVVALFMIGSTILLSVYLNATLKEVESKIDINVYFSVDAKETDVLQFKQSLELLPEVAGVVYISKDQALDEFYKRHSDDELTIQALKELENNPLRARLNVQAVSADQYDSIANYLQNEDTVSAQYGIGFIDKVNYKDNKLVIERMTTIIRGVERLGSIVTLVMIFIAVLITFNTIRLAIYISKDEINVMKLVGAGNMYIRGPFIVEGTIYGIVAALITVGLFYPVTNSLRENTEDLYGGINLYHYYITNFNEIFMILLISGAALGAISSYLAVRRYLKK